MGDVDAPAAAVGRAPLLAVGRGRGGVGRGGVDLGGGVDGPRGGVDLLGRGVGAGLVVAGLALVGDLGDVAGVAVDVVGDALGAAVGEDDVVVAVGPVAVAGLVLAEVVVAVRVLHAPRELVQRGGLRDFKIKTLLLTSTSFFFYFFIDFLVIDLLSNSVHLPC